jgi:TolA-binding protein
MIRKVLTLLVIAVICSACASSTVQHGTLAELNSVEADLQDVYLDDSLERAAQSYRRYLAETSDSAKTPEAMRRLADLQIEQAYGVMGSDEIKEMAAPKVAEKRVVQNETTDVVAPIEPSESDKEFERRATQREELLTARTDNEVVMVEVDGQEIPAGPREAIATYKQILEDYPNYERNDKVLYQMSRAYDEIGQPDEAMEVMNRFVAEYPYSKYADEVQFRRGEYYFVRRQYSDAEAAYNAAIRIGKGSSYYELSLYKVGWTLYKQQFYDEAMTSVSTLMKTKNIA